MGKAARLTLLASFVLAIPALVFGGAALWHNFVLLPPYAQKGVRTSATVVRMQADNMQRAATMEVWVEHRPDGAPGPYRNRIQGGFIDSLAVHPGEAAWQHPDDPIEVGDSLEIIYLPGSAQGRAILPQDLQQRHMAPVNRLSLAAFFIALWLAVAITHGVLRRRNGVQGAI